MPAASSPKKVCCYASPPCGFGPCSILGGDPKGLKRKQAGFRKQVFGIVAASQEFSLEQTASVKIGVGGGLGVLYDI